MKKKTTPDNREIIIIASYLQGELMDEIGSKFGISRERVRQILKRYGYTRKDGGNTFRKKKKYDEIKKLANLGFSVETIAERTGLDKRVVKSYARKEGLKLLSDIGKTHQEIKRLHDEGLNQNQISKILNTAQSNVSQILKNKFGITRKEVEVQAVKKYYELGYSYSEIAEKLGAKKANVYRIVREKIGIKPSMKKAVISKETKKTIKDLRKQGKSAKEISSLLNIGESTVYNHWNLMIKQGD